MHRNYKLVPPNKRLPYIIIRPELRVERPNVQPHSKSCECGKCKAYRLVRSQIRTNEEMKDRLVREGMVIRQVNQNGSQLYSAKAWQDRIRRVDDEQTKEQNVADRIRTMKQNLINQQIERGRGCELPPKDDRRAIAPVPSRARM